MGFRIEPLLKSQDFRDPPQVVSPSSEDMMFLKGEGSKMEVPVRESSRMRTHNASNMMDCQLYGRGQSDGRSRNVISQLIEKVRTKEDRKKSPVQEDIRTPLQRERSKSEGRTKDGIHGHGKGEPYRASSGPAGGGKVSSLYHTISGKVLGSRDSGCNEVGGIPPPPPSRRSEDPQQPMLNVSSKIDHAIALNKIREHLENHLKQKIKQRNQSASRTQLYRDGVDEEEGQYQRIAEATSQPGSSVMTEAMVHSKPASPPARRPHPRPHPHSHPVYPHSDTEDSVFYPDTPSSGFSSRCQISLSYDFPFGHSRSVADDWTSTCWGI